MKLVKHTECLTNNYLLLELAMNYSKKWQITYLDLLNDTMHMFYCIWAD